MLNNEMRPYESDADHRRQTCDALSVSRVCVLYVEARRFYGAEGRFNLPTLFVARDSIFRPVETDQNLKLGHPLDSTSGRINILPFMQNGFVVELLLSDFEGIKEPPCLKCTPNIGRISICLDGMSSVLYRAHVV